MKFKIQLLVLITSFILASIVIGLSSLHISFLTYTFFTFAFLGLLVNGFKRPFSELILLFNGFLFLGFWAKATNFIITGYRWGESAGDNSIAHLNQALLLSAWAGIILLIFQITMKRVTIRFQSLLPKGAKKVFNYKTLCLFALLMCMIAYYNWYSGFLRVGLPSETKVIFPFSVVLSWLMGPGSSFLTFLFLPSGYVWLGTVLSGILMTAFSLSSLSRNSLMYFAYPVFIKFFYNLNQYRRGIIHSAIVLVFFALSLIYIIHLRRHLYYNHPIDSVTDVSNASSQLKEVFLDRWIGIEGVLVATAIGTDEKLLQLLNEDMKIAPISQYNKMANSEYATEKRALLFSTFPGPIGMIMMAKSSLTKSMMWLGYLFILFITYLLIEFFFVGFSKSAVSWWAASTLTQISIFPKYNLKVYFCYFFFMVVFMLIFNRFIKPRNV